MVNPLYIFIIVFGAGLFLFLVDRYNRAGTMGLFYAALTGILLIAGQWLVAILQGTDTVVDQLNGSPLAVLVYLRLGAEEVMGTFLVNLAGLLSAVSLFSKFKQSKVTGMLFFLLMIVSLNGIILTRNLFVLFVFIQIGFIATVAVLGYRWNPVSVSAVFKHFRVYGISSVLLLLGLICLYWLTGTLNLDNMVTVKELLAGRAGFVALFLVVVAIVIQLAPFPVNGWALDIYKTANSGVGAMIASAGSAALLFVIYKLTPLFDVRIFGLLAGIGGVTFVFSNLLGLKQNDSKRLLGYSSIAWTGLLLLVISLLYRSTYGELTKDLLIIIISGLFLNHFLAKAGLFWLAGLFKNKNTRRLSAIRQNPLLLFVFGSFIFALIGLPPFPGFWARWELIVFLVKGGRHFWIYLILVGSFLEAVYLIRWFISVVKEPVRQAAALNFRTLVPPVLFVIGLFNAGFLMIIYYYSFSPLFYTPLMGAALFFAIDWLPTKVKGIFCIMFAGAFAHHVIAQLEGILQLFAALFLVGGLVQLITTLHATGRRNGLYPLLTMLILSLGLLVKSTTTVQFLYAWVLVMISSFCLILRGKSAQDPSFHYILFALAGSYCILLGFAHGCAVTGNLNIFALADITADVTVSYGYLLIGFLISVGVLGLHIWLPGSYAESEHDVSPLIVSVVSKAGIFGILLIAGYLVQSLVGNIAINLLLGWLGAATALVGTLLAVSQQDIKISLAYASMGQLGFIILSVAIMSHLSWLAALYLTFHHLLYMALLFLATAGLISRTGTGALKKMGGLLRRMPFTFIAVLVGLISLSGIPPLSGFGSKWLLFTAGVERSWYFQTALVFIASIIALLYCLRLMRAIFFGRSRRKFKQIKEASLWYLLPQYLLLTAIIVISVFPSLMLEALIAAVESYFPATVDWNSQAVLSRLGYWNGNAALVLTTAVFVLPLLIFILHEWKPQLVRKFTGVFKSRHPDRPEWTRRADQFLVLFQKVPVFLKRSYVTRFWLTIAGWTQSLATSISRIYSGNGQTNARHIVLFGVVLYFASCWQCN
ncbi:MAG TPA: hypothetical protein ENN20_03995 [Candidatus Marinimicrobia bacterium]|nr:hypothetical protein [Candidatus Neomarinimicrobiota bacterium]